MKANYEVIVWVEAYDENDARDIIHTGDQERLSVIEVKRLTTNKVGEEK